MDPHPDMSAQTGGVEGYPRPPRCLVTGATGYVGSRLVPELLTAGYQVRAMSRSLSRLQDHPWIDEVEPVAADARDPVALERALTGVDVAFYLIHSLGGGRGFANADRAAAQAFVQAAEKAGVRRIIYLGGLGPTDGELSEHLRSRSEVGEILLRSGVPTVVLRAAMILGAGSASFEMMRHLTERLPVMIAPRWVRTRVQPIAIGDVLDYLVGCADVPEELNRAFDIGGPDVLTYVDMIRRYAAVAGLRPRLILIVPVLTPRLSSLWVGLVTPMPAALARPLVGSLYHEVVCRDHDIDLHVPKDPGELTGFDEGVRLALRWIHDAKASPSAPERGAPADPLATDPEWTGGTLYEDVRERPVGASAKGLWRIITEIPRALAPPSLPLSRTRGRTAGQVPEPARVQVPESTRVPAEVSAGDQAADPGDTLVSGLSRMVRRVGAVLGPWRIEDMTPGALLRLRAGGPIPGIAWLELGVRAGVVPTIYTQRAMFHPRGLFGHVCWWAARPCTRAFLTGLERGVAQAAAVRRTTTGQPHGVTALREPRPAAPDR
jgi:uncharacterized protein YbjT (DUF2867 family)